MNLFPCFCSNRNKNQNIFNKLFKLNKPVGDNEALNILLVLKSMGYALVVPKKSPEDAAIPRVDHLVSVCEKIVVVKTRNNTVKVDFWDEPEIFININTLAELVELEKTNTP